MTDPVDEWAAQGLREFEGKPLVSAMQADLKLEETDEEKQARRSSAPRGSRPLDRADEGGAQGARAARCASSDRLTDSPVCLVVPEGGSPAYLERLLREHGRDMPRAKRILEVNPEHPIIEHLRKLARAGRRVRAGRPSGSSCSTTRRCSPRAAAGGPRTASPGG